MGLVAAWPSDIQIRVWSELFRMLVLLVLSVWIVKMSWWWILKSRDKDDAWRKCGRDHAQHREISNNYRATCSAASIILYSSSLLRNISISCLRCLRLLALLSVMLLHRRGKRSWKNGGLVFSRWVNSGGEPQWTQEAKQLSTIN